MKMLGRTVVLFFLSFSNLCLAQDIDYSQYTGESFSSGISARLEKPYFKEYGYFASSDYIKLTKNRKQEFEGKPESILYDVININSRRELNLFFFQTLVLKLMTLKNLSILLIQSTSFS